MSLTFINIEDSPDKPRTFGLGSGFLEDFLHNPLEQLRSLKYDKISGSWDLDKIKEILNKINEIALQNNSPTKDCEKPYQTHKVSINVDCSNNKDIDFSNLYGSFNQQQEYDNKIQRIKQMVQNYQNRVIMRSARPSSVRTTQMQQPLKCKLMSKEIQKKLQTIDLKYGMKQCQIQVKSRYMDHITSDTNNRKPNTDKSRPQTTRTNIRGYSLQREKMFDLDQKFMKTSQITRRRAFSATQKYYFNIEDQKQHLLDKLLRKCDKELHRKIDTTKYDLENKEIQPVFMLDDSDSQMKRLAKCIKFNPIQSIRNDLQNKMPGDQDFIVKQKIKIMREREKRQNGLKKKVFLVKADSIFEAQS